ncbi:hypothetical protein AB0A60_33425 [Streptomyces sp. NPDC046275]|uniref:hypothetical protein n=1 Tax=Streptomyces sp. NPDC046275 TaxID=3157201 RepID=UPI0033C95BF4
MNPRDLELTLAAARAVGPCPPGDEAAWTEQVRAKAATLYVLADVVGQDLERLDAAEQLTATLLSVGVEATSTRGFLIVRTTSGELEHLRTDRGDSDTGRSMIARARALVGHRLRVYRLNEQRTGNATRQVPTVVHLTDHGPDTDPIDEDSAKENILAAAEGDTTAASEAWQDACLPEKGSVSAEQLADAMALLPNALP